MEIKGIVSKQVPAPAQAPRASLMSRSKSVGVLLKQAAPRTQSVSETYPNEGNVASLGLTVAKLKFSLSKFRIGEDSKHGIKLHPSLLYSVLFFKLSCTPRL